MSALTYAAAQILRVLPRHGVTRFMGKLADHEWSPPVRRAVLGIYTRAYNVTFDECAKSEGWTNFDEFFTRELKVGARPLDPEPNVLSPADGRLDSLGRIEKGSTFIVKGRPYSVEELVGDRTDAERYEGGGGFVVYLSPRDYHRVHTPVSGTITAIRSMPGDYYPVNSIGMKHVSDLFVRNRRVAIAIDTKHLGRVTVVMVAAMVVGRITVTGMGPGPGRTKEDARDVPFGNHPLDQPIVRGAEIGQFHLGSTTVVLLEDSALERWLAQEGPVRYGQAVAQPRAKARSNGSR